MKLKLWMLLKFPAALFLWIVLSQTSTAQFQNNSLSQAVDNTSFNFTTDFPKAFNQKIVSNFDGDAVQMANIGNNEITGFSTFVTEATTLTFDWKVSSESSYDVLFFIILDRNQQEIGISRQISGNTDWRSQFVDIPTNWRALFTLGLH